MPIKLLQKREIDQAKARDRQVEIQEGLKLARRVDALRETQAQEEASLSKFRVDSISEIHKQIDAEVVKLDSLRGEVMELESRRKEALLPIKEELEELNKTRSYLDNRAQELDILQNDFHFKQDALLKKQVEIGYQEKRAEDMHTRAQALLAESDILREDSKIADLGSRRIFDQLKRDKISFDEKVANTENILRMKQEQLNTLQSELMNEQKRLQELEIRLIDREKTLQRNIKRYNI